MKNLPDHPVIAEIEQYGYVRESEYPEVDEDAAYEERRERDLFGE